MTKQICKVLLSYKSLINLFNYFVYLAYFKKSLSLKNNMDEINLQNYSLNKIVPSNLLNKFQFFVLHN